MIPTWIDDFVLSEDLKGFPASLGQTNAGEIGKLGLGVLQQEVEFPIAILKASALVHNRRWMRHFLERTGALLSPHGKTTMSPELIAMQIEDGAWAVTAATSAHIRSYHAYGVRRILHANQLVGAENIRGVFSLMAADTTLDFYTLVDSASGLEQLATGLERTPVGRPLQVLIEIGAINGRTGLRTDDEALALAHRIANDSRFALVGVECFEGIFSGRSSEDDMKAASMVDRCVAFALLLQGRHLFAVPDPIFSAGGSAYFALVADASSRRLGGAGYRVVLRSGCYLTHDSKHYRLIHERLGITEEVGASQGRLVAALEVWGCIQSRPEPGLALVNLGKRDISHDIDLPTPLWSCRSEEGAVMPIEQGASVTALNDQHLFLSIPDHSPLAVGDLVGFGISHPCTTFDKWKALFVVDDDYRVQQVVRTCF